MQKEIKETTEIDDTNSKKGSTNKNECSELKTLKYKTLLMNGIVWPETKSSSDLVNLDKFLENEKNSNANEPWSKLDKTVKTKKLTIFAENYKTQHNLSDDEYNKLTIFLKDCLDRKKLQRVKDVIYDKTNGEVKDVPALHHNKQSNHFTLKNTEKHISTTRSLAPKKVRGTAKNVINYDSDTSI
jgi:hypothetical protein